jgi:hypothetical protein
MAETTTGNENEILDSADRSDQLSQALTNEDLRRTLSAMGMREAAETNRGSDPDFATFQAADTYIERQLSANPDLVNRITNELDGSRLMAPTVDELAPHVQEAFQLVKGALANPLRARSEIYPQNSYKASQEGPLEVAEIIQYLEDTAANADATRKAAFDVANAAVSAWQIERESDRNVSDDAVRAENRDNLTAYLSRNEEKYEQLFVDATEARVLDLRKAALDPVAARLAATGELGEGESTAARVDRQFREQQVEVIREQLRLMPDGQDREDIVKMRQLLADERTRQEALGGRHDYAAVADHYVDYYLLHVESGSPDIRSPQAPRPTNVSGDVEVALESIHKALDTPPSEVRRYVDPGNASTEPISTGELAEYLMSHQLIEASQDLDLRDRDVRRAAFEIAVNMMIDWEDSSSPAYNSYNSPYAKSPTVLSL